MRSIPNLTLQEAHEYMRSRGYVQNRDAGPALRWRSYWMRSDGRRDTFTNDAVPHLRYTATMTAIGDRWFVSDFDDF